MRCIIRIDRKGIELSPAEVNSLLREVVFMSNGLEVDKYTIKANYIKIYIHPKDIEENLCNEIKETLEREIKRILKKKEL